jgi:hypothetical protein
VRHPHLSTSLGLSRLAAALRGLFQHHCRLTGTRRRCAGFVAGQATRWPSPNRCMN